MSLIVRADETGGPSESSSAGTRGTQATAKRWVTFSPSEANAASGGRDGDGDRFPDRFRVEVVRTLRGAPLSLGTDAITGSTFWRREVIAPRRPTVAGPFCGSIEGRHSSTDEEVAGLTEHWRGNPFRVALVVACAHSGRFSALKPEERTFDYLGTPDASTAARVPVLRRIVRQLHRGDGGHSEWDSFAYLEMLPEHVAHLREYLEERRDASRVSRFVERAVEIWMVKHLDLLDHAGRPAGA